MSTTANFDENSEVMILNEGKYTVVLHDPMGGRQNSTVKINPQGKKIMAFKDLRDFMYSTPGNREIIINYLTIPDPIVRQKLDIDHKEIVTDEILDKMLSLTSKEEIDKKLVKFVKELEGGELDRIAQMAVDKQVSDMRILNVLKKYTPYSNIIKQIEEDINLESNKIQTQE